MSSCNRPDPATTGTSSPATGTKKECPCPTKVQFKEQGDKYGWDEKTDASVPWKAVEKGQSDTVEADTTPPDKAAQAELSSSDTAKATISPAKASSNKTTVTITGVEKGETEIKGVCKGATLGKMKVKVYPKKVKSVAVRLVHEKNYTSTDITDATIEAALKKVYMQAAVEFKVTRLPAKTVEFDKNKDGKVDVNAWMNDEMKAIRDASKDDSYDFNIFLVDKPNDGSCGMMDFNQRYGFVHPDECVSHSCNTGQVVSHELGHGQGLVHIDDDKNLMYKYADPSAATITRWRLRKDQWDKVNP